MANQAPLSSYSFFQSGWMQYGNDQSVKCSNGENESLNSSFQPLIEETPDMLKNALRQFEAAVDMLPESSRQAYGEAAVRCPHLVATETNPILWLRFERFNVWEAAHRFVLYWEFRKKIFGDRAFYSLLNFTASETALNDDDFSNLESGAIVLLPPSSKDCIDTSIRRGATTQLSTFTEKRHIMFSDRTRLHGKFLEMDSCLRLAFYFFSYIINTEVMRPVLNTIQVVDLMQFVPKHKVGLISLELGRKIMPAKIEPFIVAVPYTMKRSFTQIMLPACVKRLGNFLGKDRFIIEVGNSKLDIQQKLEAHNMVRSCLPQSVGGSWTYDNFNTWYQQQHSIGIKADVLVDFSRSVERKALDSDIHKMELSAPTLLPKPIKRARKRAYDDGFNPEMILTLMTSSDKNSAIVSHNDRATLIEQLDRLNEALKRIPWTDRGALMEAVDRSPFLAVIEANALQFLKCDNDEASAAAQRLSLYWRKRRELFGEKAFVSVMDWEPKEFGPMKLPIFSLLAYCNGDEPIVLVDLSTSIDHDELEFERSAFYCLSKAMSEYDIKNGITLLLVLSEDNLEWAVTQTALSRLLPLFPITFSVVHVVVRAAKLQLMRHPSVSSRVLASIIGSVGKEVHMYSGNETTDFSQALERAGFVRDNLPPSLWEGMHCSTGVENVSTAFMVGTSVETTANIESKVSHDESNRDDLRRKRLSLNDQIQLDQYGHPLVQEPENERITFKFDIGEIEANGTAFQAGPGLQKDAVGCVPTAQL